MASLSGVNALHEIPLLIDFRVVWNTDVRMRVGDLPPDNHGANVCRPWRIPDVNITERSACDASRHGSAFHHFCLCHILVGNKRY